MEVVKFDRAYSFQRSCARKPSRAEVMNRDYVLRLLDFVLREATIRAQRGADQPWERMSPTVGMALREASNWALSDKPLEGWREVCGQTRRSRARSVFTCDRGAWPLRRCGPPRPRRACISEKRATSERCLVLGCEKAARRRLWLRISRGRPCPASSQPNRHSRRSSDGASAAVRLAALMGGEFCADRRADDADGESRQAKATAAVIECCTTRFCPGWRG